MIAFTFPGQGSQKPGAGAAWTSHPSWSVVDAASDAAGRDVARLLLDADADELRHTDNAQLSTYVASLLVLDAVRRAGIDASYVAGHSLGEYTALTAAGVLSLEDGVRLVVARGSAMRDAATQKTGTMAAVLGADDDAVELACSQTRAAHKGSAAGEVWVANYNSEGQVVIAGSAEGIEAAGALAKDAGAKRVMPVAVSGAFHTPYMAPAQRALDAALAGARLADADVPAAANVDGAVHTSGREWTALLSEQLCNPVRWRQLLAGLAGVGVDTFIELGPGTVLTGLTKRGVDGASTHNASTPEGVDELQAALPVQARSRVEGETLYAVERLLVSTAAGVFEPAASLRDGARVNVGDVLGRVGEHVVRSRFSGFVIGQLARQGERVATSQPLAWLRVF